MTSTDEVEMTTTQARTAGRRLRAFRSEPWLLAGLGVVLAALASLFPPSGDDWAWGTSIGTDRLRDGFAGYNGRWLGNFAVLFLTRASWLTPLVVAATICLIVALLVHIADLRTPAGYLVAAALVVAMPVEVWRQTIVWVSGFSNYALASLCLLVFVACVRWDWGEAGWRAPRVTAVLVLPFAVASALFMEHVTLALVLASLANLALLLRHRRPVWVAAAWAAGSVLGAAIMFSNAAYRAVAAGTSTYQSADDGGLGGIVRQGTGGVSQYAVAINTVLNVALLVVLAALALIRWSRSQSLTRGQVAAVAAAAVTVAAGAAVTSSVDRQNYFGELTGWSWTATLGLLAAIVLGARYLVADRDRARTVLLLTLVTAFLIAPMAALHPYGPRNFLPTYLLMSLVVLVLLRELVAQAPEPLIPVALGLLGAGVCLAVLAGYLVIYGTIHRAEDLRIEKIEQAVDHGQRRVSVYELPHAGYVHNPDPVDSAQMSRFKRYYGLPPRLRIVIVPRG